MVELLRVELIQMRDGPLDLRTSVDVGGCRDYPANQGQNAMKRQGIEPRTRQRELFNDRNIDVGSDAHPNQIVRDEAVEHRAQEQLMIRVDVTFEAEQRVCGDGVRRYDRRN